MYCLTSASSVASTQPLTGLFSNSVITEFLFILLWVLAPYAGSEVAVINLWRNFKTSLIEIILKLKDILKWRLHLKASHTHEIAKPIYLFLLDSQLGYLLALSYYHLVEY